MGWVVNATLRPLYPGIDPTTVVQEDGLAPGPVWTGAENLAPSPGFDPRTIQAAAVAIPTELSLPLTKNVPTLTV